ncbi:phosphate/phosphite/phosphonate ABC transporter substrate-binding protein [Calothrix sp. UHCC 0171]|uniref:phosphate/phosphite/phosphonate ABC transporter substrate-binding protein n=1 Tax=Calothrix sp. UHCC 0171 TaxID=3110245 RepID=UPI002B2186FE|nr:phosphate/phosphite/phosphonate ABC transporter substrate-binding protein [Calothrix sp. UHCC 0171]MEA5571087.1 phosphate/phosphite/phosphonate ABC transporter substrate-binding protein [Calothrix sp. UHCC 0171]
MRSLVSSLYLFSWLIPFWLGACSASPPKSTQKSPPSSQETVLRISVQPTQDRFEQERMIAPLDAHLEQVLGQQVDFIIAKNYQESVDMVVDGRANGVYGGVVSYFEALERGAKVKPLVAPIDADTVRPWYRSCLVVAANSSIKTLQDLKGKRVAFVDRSSTSGYLVPLAALKQEGIDPDRHFSQVVFGGTHGEIEELLATNQVDAIATNLATYNQRQQQGEGEKPLIIWESDPIPHAPILVSSDLPPELIKKLKKAFLTTPAGIQDLMGAKSAGYTLVEDEDYESIGELRRQLNLARGSNR